MTDLSFDLFLKNPKILVVDDDADFAEIAAEILRGHGAKVETAKDGGKALIAAKSFDPDLIVSDLAMPMLRGDQLLAELRKSGYEKPFILLTGMGEVSSVTAALRNHAFDYLIKPVSPQVLSAAVSNALRSEYQRLVTAEELNEVYSALQALSPPPDGGEWREVIRKKALARVREKRKS